MTKSNVPEPNAKSGFFGISWKTAALNRYVVMAIYALSALIAIGACVLLAKIGWVTDPDTLMITGTVMGIIVGTVLVIGAFVIPRFGVEPSGMGRGDCLRRSATR